jgi:hypothetical protein
MNIIYQYDTIFISPYNSYEYSIDTILISIIYPYDTYDTYIIIYLHEYYANEYIIYLSNTYEYYIYIYLFIITTRTYEYI